MVGGAKLADVCAILQRRAFGLVGKGEAPKDRPFELADGLGWAIGGSMEGHFLVPPQKCAGFLQNLG